MPLATLQESLRQGGVITPQNSWQEIQQYYDLTGDPNAKKVLDIIMSPIPEVQKSISAGEIEPMIKKAQTVIARSNGDPELAKQTATAYDRGQIKNTSNVGAVSGGTGLPSSTPSTGYSAIKDPFNFKEGGEAQGWEGFYKPASELEYASAVAGYKQLMPNKTDAEIQQLVSQDFVSRGIEQAKQAEGTAGSEEQVASLLKAFPDAYKAQEADLANRLSGYGSKMFEEKMMPSINRSYAAMGRLGGGGLTEALARTAGDVNASVQNQLAPTAVNAWLSNQSATLENALRQAQNAGTQGQDLTNYARSLYGQSLGTLGQTAQANLGADLNERLLGVQNKYNRQNMDYANQLQSDQTYQNALGGLGGTLLSTLLGGGIGALAYGGLKGAGKGSLMGLTGKYY